MVRIVQELTFQGLGKAASTIRAFLIFESLKTSHRFPVGEV
jgi:hypothetical protein